MKGMPEKDVLCVAYRRDPWPTPAAELGSEAPSLLLSAGQWAWHTLAMALVLMSLERHDRDGAGLSSWPPWHSLVRHSSCLPVIKNKQELKLQRLTCLKGTQQLSGRARLQTQTHLTPIRYPVMSLSSRNPLSKTRHPDSFSSKVETLWRQKACLKLTG